MRCVVASVSTRPEPLEDECVLCTFVASLSVSRASIQSKPGSEQISNDEGCVLIAILNSLGWLACLPIGHPIGQFHPFVHRPYYYLTDDDGLNLTSLTIDPRIHMHTDRAALGEAAIGLNQVRQRHRRARAS